MIYTDTPSLGFIRGGTELRHEATKLMSAAEIAFDLGGRDGKELLLAFWQFQKDALKANYGHPSDGPYLGIGYVDIRRQCYKVLTHIRCHRNPAYEKMWNDFCDYFIMHSWDLDENESKVASLKITPIYKGENTEYAWSDSNLVCSVDILDASGHSLVASAEKPLLGKVDWMLMTEGGSALQGKWREDWKSVTESPYTMSVGSISTRNPGDNVVKLRYVYKDREVVGQATYKRAAKPEETA